MIETQLKYCPSMRKTYKQTHGFDDDQEQDINVQTRILKVTIVFFLSSNFFLKLT